VLLFRRPVGVERLLVLVVPVLGDLRAPFGDAIDDEVVA